MDIHQEDVLKDEQENLVPQDVIVSVYMLAYMHEGFIGRAIESILMQQTNFRFELCIGEDDSSDRTREICLEYAKQYPETIRLFLRSRDDVVWIDGKPTGRRNAILSRAACRGKYIAICEGDDFWIDEYKLQKQFDFMEGNLDYSICGTLGIERVEGSTVADVIKPCQGACDFDHKWFLQGKTGMLTASLFWRADCVKEGIMTDLNIMIGDWALLVSITEGHKKCAVLPYVCVVYRKHAGGAWAGSLVNSAYKLEMRTSAYQQYLKYAPEEDHAEIELQIDLLNRSLTHVECAGRRVGKFKFLLLQLCSTGGLRYLSTVFRKRFF